jgi:hypothetical protein
MRKIVAIIGKYRRLISTLIWACVPVLSNAQESIDPVTSWPRRCPPHCGTPGTAFDLGLPLRHPDVGGFGGVSLGHATLKIFGTTHIPASISYDRTKPDGSRLELTVNDRLKTAPVRWTVPVWDWQIIPVAKLVDQGGRDIVSLFGDGPDLDKFYYVWVNPVFRDTLLGLRLLQADLLPIWASKGEQLKQLPESNTFAPGEPPFDSETSESALKQFWGILAQSSIENWVVTDFDTHPEVRFETRFEINSDPYYLFCESIEWHDADPNGLSKSSRVGGGGDCIPAWTAIDGVRKNRNALRNGAPAIFNSVEQASFLTELFFSIQGNDPASWKAFLQELDKDGPLSTVSIPHQIPR